MCQKICLYRLQVTWNPPQWDPSQLKHPTSGNIFPVPSFHFIHCKVEIPSNILRTSQSGETNENSSPINSLYSLIHLQIIPGPLDNQAGSTASPWMLGVFSNSLHPTSNHSQQQIPSSVIVRWQLESATQSLHPKFDEVAQKRSGSQVKVRTEAMLVDGVLTVLAENGTAPARRYLLR